MFNEAIDVFVDFLTSGSVSLWSSSKACVDNYNQFEL